MKIKTFATTTSVTALLQFIPFLSHSQTPASPDAPVPIVLTRATNNVIGASNNVRTVTVWSDYTLQPGEAFSVSVQRGAELSHPQPASLFVHWRPESTRTSSGFSWFFGGPLGPGFGEAEADAALAQIKDRFADHTTTLTPGQPQQLFSVKNQAGVVMNGLIEFTRPTPVPAESAKATVQLQEIQAMSPMSPSVGYSASVPPGYALRATANTGSVNTMSPAGPIQYRATWMNLPTPHHLKLAPGQRPPPSLPPKPLSPQEMESQRKVLQAEFQELQQQGLLEVALGTPKQIFSITNSSGDVLQGFLELVGPGMQKTSTASTSAEKSQPANEHLVRLAEQQSQQIKTSLPAASAAPGMPAGTINPATGLPRSNSTAAH